MRKAAATFLRIITSAGWCRTSCAGIVDAKDQKLAVGRMRDRYRADGEGLVRSSTMSLAIVSSSTAPRPIFAHKNLEHSGQVSHSSYGPWSRSTNDRRPRRGDLPTRRGVHAALCLGTGCQAEQRHILLHNVKRLSKGRSSRRAEKQFQPGGNISKQLSDGNSIRLPLRLRNWNADDPLIVADGRSARGQIEGGNPAR